MDSVFSNDAYIFWDSFLKTIEDRINAQSFNTWFKPLNLNNLTVDTLFISVPQSYYSSWLEEHYISLIKSTASSILGRNVLIKFIISDEKNDATNSLVDSRENSIDSSKFSENKTSYDNFYGQININPRFTFESFIVGSSNQFAHAASKAVADAPGRTAFNPLVIYGGVGLGKTHILQAIAHRYLNSGKHDISRSNVIFVSSEKFTMDFILSIQNNQTAKYSQIYRNANLLLVDDIQFFNNKERTQEEFFHIFNDLHQKGKQIVLSMDCPPINLKGLADRLINRFQWGLVTDIQPPDFETRVAILKKKAVNDGVDLDNSIAEFIAENITTNIRELEGSLIRLLAYSSLHGIDMSLEMAYDVLGDTIRKTSRIITIEYIQKLVAQHFSLPVNLITGTSRRKEVAEARHIAIYLCKQLTSSSLKTIGLNFSGRDHSTVIHSTQKIEKKLQSDSSFSKLIQSLTNQAKNAE
ncbi:MAG: chromosomal replication initiator protein DnaA [Candidatus Latescibacteria bacterium]|nr:chromosomal replication initiator protein DnaA [Candidatus Latescibacterota bacterium]